MNNSGLSKHDDVLTLFGDRDERTRLAAKVNTDMFMHDADPPIPVLSPHQTWVTIINTADTPMVSPFL